MTDYDRQRAYEDERAAVIASYDEHMAMLETPRPSRIERIVFGLLDAFEAITDEFARLLVKVPPFSWVDAILRGPVGPRK